MLSKTVFLSFHNKIHMMCNQFTKYEQHIYTNGGPMQHRRTRSKLALKEHFLLHSLHILWIYIKLCFFSSTGYNWTNNIKNKAISIKNYNSTSSVMSKISLCLEILRCTDKFKKFQVITTVTLIESLFVVA